MIRPRTKRHNLPAPDSRGRIRPCVGRRHDGIKARFTVGNNSTSSLEAEKRLGLLRNLYEKQCERFNVNRWLGWTHAVAQRIAAGQPIVDCCLGEHPQQMVAVVQQLQAWGISVTIAQTDRYAEGASLNQEYIEVVVQELVAKEIERLTAVRGPVAANAVLPSNPIVMAETATFHQAIKVYCKHLEKTGKRDNEGNLVTRVGKCQDRLKYLREHHEDLPLWKLNLPVLEELTAYWRNRPTTKKRARCGKQHARDMIKELWRFLRWLDDQPNYKWEMPRGASKISRSPHDLPDDNKDDRPFQTTTKETYTPEELAIIVQHTDASGKALVGVCVNCAFGASEVGQWPTNKYLIRTAHEHGDRLGISTSDADSWIVGSRPKTGVYGEHWLWPQVAEAVGLTRRTRLLARHPKRQTLVQETQQQSAD